MKHPRINRIKLLRQIKDLTQEELAEKLGISRQSLISLEQGKCLPSLHMADQLARFFNATIEELFNFNKGEEVKTKRFGLPFDELFGMDWEEKFNAFPWTQARGLMGPRVNVYQTEDEVVVEAEVPGMDEKDIKIEVTDDYITVSGEKIEEVKTEKENYFRRELSYGGFRRQIMLPVEVESEKAKAATRAGLLMIRIPKKPVKKGKVIKIISEEKK